MKRPFCRSSLFCFFLIAFGVLFPSFVYCLEGSNLQGMETEIQGIFNKARDSVVRIKTIVPISDVAHGQVVAEGLSVGTGFFVDARGLILTTARVLSGADKAIVYWRDKAFEAQVIGKDLRTNIALLKIEAITPYLEQGDPHELKVGSMAFAVGFPMDGSVSAEYGYISNPAFISGFVSLSSQKNVSHMPEFIATSHIRCSVRVQPGESGSPLLNTSGKVIGMVVCSMEEDNSTFAFPINAAVKIQKDLVQYRVARHGWTGLNISCNQLSPDGGQIAIRDVFVDSPGYSAGIRPGDILKKIGSREIRSPVDVINSTFYLSVGETVNFSVERGGKAINLPLKVVQRPTEKELANLKQISLPVQ